jgi:argininosuccinate lyase
VLDDLPLEAYKAHSELFDNDLYTEILLETCVAKRKSEGGTSVMSVEKQIAYVREELAK